MRHGSLFSGISGFDLAAQWMGWENVFQCEIDGFCQKVLAKNFPQVKYRYGDIRETDFTIHRGGIDWLTGGDPCQGNSVIGKMEGEKYEGFLWNEMLRATEEILPGGIVNENVTGSISNGILDRKMRDLNKIGYACRKPTVIPANFCGASHIRKRVWLVADRIEGRLERRHSVPQERQREIKIRPIQALVENQNGAICPRPEFLRDYDGLSPRVDRLKGLGSAIVPQIAFEIFKAIEQTNLDLTA